MTDQQSESNNIPQLHEVYDIHEVHEVQNSLNYWDVLYCRSMPFHPSIRILQTTLIGAAVMYFLNLAFGFQQSNFYVLIWFPIVYPLTNFIAYKKSKHNLTSTIKVNELGIEANVKSGATGKIEWKNVQKIGTKHDAIYIQISKQPDLYYWIPMRNFKSRESALEFLIAAKEHWQNLRFEQPLALTPLAEITDHSRSVDVKLSPKELLIYDYYLLKHLPLWGIFLLVCTIPSILAGFMGTAVFNFLIVILLLAVPAIGVQKKVKNHPEWLEGRLSITSEGFSSEGKLAGMDVAEPWKSVKRIKKWHNAIFFIRKTGYAIVIPMKSFPTRQAADRFYEQSQEYFKSAALIEKMAKISAAK